jgi:hypothetical protein
MAAAAAVAVAVAAAVPERIGAVAALVTVSM